MARSTVDRFLTFLRRLIKDAAQKVFLVVDNLKVHHSIALKGAQKWAF